MKILNFGSLNIDKVYRVPYFVKPGETISSHEYQCFPGGKGLNQSIALLRAGCPVYHAGCIGEDGSFLRSLLESEGGDVSFLRTGDGPTGHALIQVADSGENCIILFPGTNRQNTIEDIDRVLAQFSAGDLLLLQNEISNLPYLLKKAAEMGLRIMLNPSPMDDLLMSTELSGITWLMLNETEGKKLTGHSQPDAIAAALLQKYPKMHIILTLGEDGALYLDAQDSFRQSCFPAKAIDTTAAGDTFTGYFAAGLVEGKTPKEALQLAACAASVTVSVKGAAVSIPLRRTVDKMLRQFI